MLIRFSKHTIYPFLVFLLLLSFQGCIDECEDCEPKILQPLVIFNFINTDSLDAVDTSIEQINEISDSISGIESSLAFDIDSLEAEIDTLDQRIEAGETGLLDEREILVESIERLTDSTEVLLGMVDSLNSEIASSNGIRNLILSGLIKVDEVQNLENNKAISYEDSVADYQLPLNMNIKKTEYMMIIANLSYRIGLSYDFKDSLNARGEFRRYIRDLEISSYSNFDTTYINDEGTIICNF